MRAMQASLLTRFGSAAAVAVLATGGAMATATAASAAGHPKPKPKLDATTLSIKNKVIAHGRHHADAITGVLRDEHTRVANEKITLDARAGKQRRWTAVTSGTTDATGSVMFTVTPTRTTQFKLVFAGDSTFGKSHSNVITLKAVKK
jgi:hypothetical protein